MEAFEKCKLLAMDIRWKRPAETSNEYRGCMSLFSSDQLLSVTIIYTI